MSDPVIGRNFIYWWMLFNFKVYSTLWKPINIYSFLIPENKYIVPGIVVDEGTDIIINQCEIRGNTKNMYTMVTPPH